MVGAWIIRPVKARKLVSPAAEAEAFRPARISRAGNIAPRKGRAAMRKRDTVDFSAVGFSCFRFAAIIYVLGRYCKDAKPEVSARQNVSCIPD